MVPQKICKTYLMGQNLSELPARTAKKVGNPRRIISEQENRHRFHTAFVGDIVVSIYESGPAKLQIENSLYDELIHVLEGSLVLTDTEGFAQKIETGGFVVMPRGFCGTWEMVGDAYRELVVIERDTLEHDMAAS